MILGFSARAGLLIASLFVTAGTAAAETVGAETRTPSTVTADAPPHAAVTVDHHAHVHSPAILDFLPKYCGSDGRIGPCPEVFTRAYSPEDLIAEMDAAGVARSLIMSTGYLAESPMMQPPASRGAQDPARGERMVGRAGDPLPGALWHLHRDQSGLLQRIA